MSSLSEPEPSPSSSSPSSPYALIDTLAEYGIPIIDLCLIIESFLTPADIWYRCLFEGWRVPPTSDSTADEYLLCFAEEGGDVELDQAIAWGATRLEDALRIAAKHNQQRVAAVLVERGVLRTYQNQFTIALSKEVGCAELRCELGKIDAWCRDKIRNTLLFFRWKWLNDDAFRGIYCTEEVREWLDENEELASAAPDVRGGQRQRSCGRTGCYQTGKRRRARFTRNGSRNCMLVLFTSGARGRMLVRKLRWRRLNQPLERRHARLQCRHLLHQVGYCLARLIVLYCDYPFFCCSDLEARPS